MFEAQDKDLSKITFKNIFKDLKYYMSKSINEVREQSFLYSNINQPDPQNLPGTKPPTKEYTWRDPWLQLHMQQRISLSGINERRVPWLCEGSVPQCRKMSGQGNWKGVCRWVEKHLTETVGYDGVILEMKSGNGRTFKYK